MHAHEKSRRLVCTSAPSDIHHVVSHRRACLQSAPAQATASSPTQRLVGQAPAATPAIERTQTSRAGEGRGQARDSPASTTRSGEVQHCHLAPLRTRGAVPRRRGHRNSPAHPRLSAAHTRRAGRGSPWPCRGGPAAGESRAGGPGAADSVRQRQEEEAEAEPCRLRRCAGRARWLSGHEPPGSGAGSGTRAGEGARRALSHVAGGGRRVPQGSGGLGGRGRAVRLGHRVAALAAGRQGDPRRSRGPARPLRPRGDPRRGRRRRGAAGFQLRLRRPARGSARAAGGSGGPPRGARGPARGAQPAAAGGPDLPFGGRRHVSDPRRAASHLPPAPGCSRCLEISQAVCRHPQPSPEKHP